MKRLKDKVALVTAVAKGLELEVVRELAQSGAMVYLAAGSEDLGNRVKKQLAEESIEVTLLHLKALDESSIKQGIEEIIKEAGKLDILVNNVAAASIQGDLDVMNCDLKVWTQALESNLTFIYLTSKYAIGAMIKSGGGAIVNVSSMASVLPDISKVAYGVAKAGINSLTKNIAVQYGRQGIRCNGVLPGIIETEAVKENIPEEFRNRFRKHVPLNRLGRPEDFTKAILYFVSDDSSYVTGQLLEVSGGLGIAIPLYGDFMEKGD